MKRQYESPVLQKTTLFQDVLTTSGETVGEYTYDWFEEWDFS
jgi:hypothetical protein